MATLMTQEVLEKLQKELDELKTTKRREVADRLRRAAAFGDLSENFDYANAKEEQEMLERRIAELSERVREANIVEKGSSDGRVKVGSVVELKDEGGTTAYEIVTAAEADPLKGRVSPESPVGEALMGRQQGDTVAVQTPEGVVEYAVQKVS